MTGGWLARSRASANWSSPTSGAGPSSAPRSLISSTTDSEAANVRRMLSSNSSAETGTSSNCTPYERSRSSRTSGAASPATATRNRSPATSRGRMPLYSRYSASKASATGSLGMGSGDTGRPSVTVGVSHKQSAYQRPRPRAYGDHPPVLMRVTAIPAGPRWRSARSRGVKLSTQCLTTLTPSRLRLDVEIVIHGHPRRVKQLRGATHVTVRNFEGDPYCPLLLRRITSPFEPHGKRHQLQQVFQLDNFAPSRPQVRTAYYHLELPYVPRPLRHFQKRHRVGCEASGTAYLGYPGTALEETCCKGWDIVSSVGQDREVNHAIPEPVPQLGE